MIKPTCRLSLFVFLYLSMLGWQCTDSAGAKNARKTASYDSYATASTYNDAGKLQAIIEIPAGTNKKYEFDKEQKKFIQDEVNGKPRVISFLPYPGNYGFIPSTILKRSEGGDDDQLDILVIGESIERGTMLEVTPIGALMLIDEGENDTKIIAVPADKSKRTIDVDNFLDFNVQYGAAKQILEQWFMHYDPNATTYAEGWRDETYAQQLIKKVMQKDETAD